jgi:hypothetical protein
VILEHQGNDLNATFTLANTLPPTGEFTLAVLASSTDGSKARVLGAHWLDGKLIGYYVVDSAQSPTQRNLKGEPFVDGTVIKPHSHGVRSPTSVRFGIGARVQPSGMWTLTIAPSQAPTYSTPRRCPSRPHSRSWQAD